MTVIPIRIHMFILQYNNDCPIPILTNTYVYLLQYNNDCYSYYEYNNTVYTYNITMTVIPIRIHMFILQYNNDCYSYSNTYVYLTI